jgi:phosphoglycolate phosphatase
MINSFHGVRAVLFDLDGTLVETNIDFALMKQEMVALAGTHGIPASEVQDLNILAVVDRIATCVQANSGEEAAARVRQEAFEKLEQIELGHCEDSSAIPYAAELIDSLRHVGIKIGIVTRNCRSAAAFSMERGGIRADVLLTRDDVRNTKPHPEHLLLALELLDVEPAHAVMVGDHWMDIEGGKAARIRTIGILRPDRPEHFFDAAAPDLVIHDLKELLVLADRLNK